MQKTQYHKTQQMHHSTHPGANQHQQAVNKIHEVNDAIDHESKMKAKYQQKLMEEVSKKPGEKRMTTTEYIRAQCLSRGCNGIRDFGRVFRIMDDDSSKALNRDELMTGLRDIKVDLTDEEMDKVFMEIDKDNTGSISFDEFLEAVRPPMSENRKNLIMKCFDCMDKTGDNVITVEDLGGKYSCKDHPKFKNGEWSRKRCMEEFLKSFESKDSDGSVTKEEFLNHYAGVSASIDNDAYFDLIMRKGYNLEEN